ncbi:helix-turn-helix domain-containing protein [Amycolatopsis sp. QT-25]|uniref:AraC family transcriptional regulator n=1 Tax=Amycolatopsis sp. QT-25 TaxID=3034022 RepID=UPI0023EB45AB|nr:helix-turn-helix domain-containing protein [Amycolatopsis sp. QT-25]WET76828.1 helix-turn-helix domain-containing protein [Amycolatopsis sp. QT-25]
MRDNAATTSAGQSWHTRRPNRRLGRWVNFYLAYRRTTGVSMVRTVAALNSILVIIDLAPGIRRARLDSPFTAISPVTGMTGGPISYERLGHEEGVIVELTPLGARALFGIPLSELGTARVGMADLLGEDARRLTERLWETETVEGRFRILDRWLAKRLLDGPMLSKALEGSWRSLTLSQGNVRITELANRAGVSRQHLATGFHREIGLSPKTVARVARCHSAIRLITGRNPPPLSTVAQLCGYTDQAHLNRDFRLLVDTTPTGLLRSGDSCTDLFLGSEIALRPRQRTGTPLESGLPLS